MDVNQVVLSSLAFLFLLLVLLLLLSFPFWMGNCDTLQSDCLSVCMLNVRTYCYLTRSYVRLSSCVVYRICLSSWQILSEPLTKHSDVGPTGMIVGILPRVIILRIQVQGMLFSTKMYREKAHLAPRRAPQRTTKRCDTILFFGEKIHIVFKSSSPSSH